MIAGRPGWARRLFAPSRRSPARARIRIDRGGPSPPLLYAQGYRESEIVVPAAAANQLE